MFVEGPAAGRAHLAIFLVFAALGMPVLAAGASWEEPKSSWRNGPVRELLTPDEDKAFRSLKTDDERAKAIADFWTRRDPTPGTPENEYHTDFARRVEFTDAQFGEGTGPGWTTERGRLFLLAGGPTGRKSGVVDGVEQETWTYSQFADVPEFADYKGILDKIAFVKQESGEMRGSPEAAQLSSVLHKLDPAALAKLTTPKGAVTSAPKPPAAAAAPVAPPAAAAPAAPPAAPLPAGVDRLKQAAMEAEPKTEIGMLANVRYFMAEGGSTRAVVLIAVKKTDIAVVDNKPRTLLYARLLPEGADAAPIEFYEQQLYTLYDDTGEGWLKYAFAWTLSRKSYELRLAVSDGVDGKIATSVQTLSLPDYKADALQMSSVTLARVSVPSGPGDKPESEDAYRIGSLRLVPWVKPTIGPKDDLAFFYDVYHARRDPGTNKPQLDVSYVIAKKEAAGWKPRGHLDEIGKQEERLGYTIPSETLTAWPAGDYRLTVQVKDKIANTSTSSSVEFSLVK
jgi:GWxTD domain-containing protein